MEQATWNEIEYISSLKAAPSYWSVGDIKNITLQTYGTLTLEIVDFNHDTLSSTNTNAGITFGTRNLLSGITKRMGSSPFGQGYTDSVLYNFLLNNVFPSLPEELRNVIKTVKKKDVYDQWIDMRLFSFSQAEVVGADQWVSDGYQYSIFTNNQSRIKKSNNGTGNASSWWLRTPKETTPYSWMSISESGEVTLSSPSSLLGVVFGFCV